MLRAGSPPAPSIQLADFIISAGIAAYVMAAIIGLYIADHSGVSGLLISVAIAWLHLAVCAVVAVWILVRCSRRTIHRSPFLLLSAFMLGIPFVVDTDPYARPLIDWARLHLNRAAYEGVISDNGSSKVQAFYWGANYRGGHHYLLVFDESGEIMQVGAARSEAWEKKVVPDSVFLIDGGCFDEASHISGNFYSVLIYCRQPDP